MKRKDILAVLLLMMLVGIFTAPLWLHGGTTLSFYPKNFFRVGNYLDLAMIRKAFFTYLQFPLWAPNFEGGIPLFAFPGDTTLNPVSTVLLLVFNNDVVVDNLTWVILYISGAVSMYYLCRGVLGFNISGAFLSSIVFSMNGLLPYLQHNGLTQARMTLLLPLLIAFFLKANNNRKFAVYAGMVLALLIFDAALFVPVILLFSLFIVTFEALQRGHVDRQLLRKTMVTFCLVLGLGILYSCVKIVPMIDTFGVRARPEALPYGDYITDPNTISVLLTRLLYPVNHWPGMFVGVLPLALCVTAGIVYFRKMAVYVAGLVLAIWLSFGPNAAIDLHKVLWHLPVFHEMKETNKYYGLLIVFFISILSGSALVFLNRFRVGNGTKILSFIIIAAVYMNLAWSNVGYFNAFDTSLNVPDQERSDSFYSVEMMNGHPGDESISTLLSYFLFKKNIGFINQYIEFKKKTTVSPKYFLVPGYVFLMPSTALMVLPNPFYTGEAYFLGSKSRVRLSSGTFNRLVFDVLTPGPDRLVLNQNFEHGWKSSQGKVEPYHDLISVRLEHAVHGRVTVQYVPVLFLIGCIISAMGLGGSVIYLTRVQKKCI